MKQSTINQTITKRYRKSKQQLNLGKLDIISDFLHENWKKVLEHNDWSELSDLQLRKTIKS